MISKTAQTYKKIDPFADTETAQFELQRQALLRYKKIDPFADTETPDQRGG